MTDMLRVAVYRSSILTQEELTDPSGTKWMTGAHEGMINKKEGERT